MRITFGFMICLAIIPVVRAQEQAPRAKVRVEIRWIENKKIDGVTEEKGFQSSCDPKSIVYPHKKPALVLTPADVAETRLKEIDFSGSGLGKNYMVAIHLTKEARAALAATCKSNEMQMLSVVVDGKYWGVTRYEKDKTKKFVPEQCRAETFLPEVGFFSSKAEAERLANAFK